MKDARGDTIRIGDRVRIIGTPDLSGMSPSAKRESERVFQHLIGTYKRVEKIDDLGNVVITFKIRRKMKMERHWVGLEPFLIQKRRPKKSVEQVG